MNFVVVPDPVVDPEEAATESNWIDYYIVRYDDSGTLERAFAEWYHTTDPTGWKAFLEERGMTIEGPADFRWLTPSVVEYPDLAAGSDG